MKREHNNNRRTLSFLGLPGSGKGTQVEILSKKIAATILEMGEIIREEIKKADLSDPFYANLKKLYDQGIPQSDEVVIDMLRKNIQKIHGNLILDNFPFSEQQAIMFFHLCKELVIREPTLIIVNISKQTSEKRILKRKICSSCHNIVIDNGSQICDKCGGALIARSDDNEETLTNRISQYLPRIKAVKKQFELHGLVLDIDGEKSIKEVAKEIEDKVINESIK